MTLPESVPLVPEPSREQLSERQVVDYELHREEFLEWLYIFGKAPDQGEGYSASTLRNTAYRTDKFSRWVWGEDRYTIDFTHSHADSYLRDIAISDQSQSNKASILTCLKRYFKWRVHEKGADEWEPEFTFSGGEHATQPRDFFTREERSMLREAALEYGSIPGYNDLTPSERNRWKVHLSQRFEKPKTEVTPADWDRANGWKIPSLVWVSLDCGLRPVEVGNARIQWVDIENGLLRIPEDESAKNRDNWVVGLTDRTAEALDRWLTERRAYSKYDNTDSIWLTREGNPYSSPSLKYLVGRLCEEAGISSEGRSLSWYTIRHSVGTYMTREEDLAAAAAQLRHKSTQTTMKYDNTPVEDRKKALERMG